MQWTHWTVQYIKPVFLETGSKPECIAYLLVVWVHGISMLSGKPNIHNMCLDLMSTRTCKTNPTVIKILDLTFIIFDKRPLSCLGFLTKYQENAEIFQNHKSINGYILWDQTCLLLHSKQLQVKHLRGKVVKIVSAHINFWAFLHTVHPASTVSVYF